MYSSLFDAVFTDSFFSPMRTVYVVSDSQLEELKRKEHQEELDNIETSRKRLFLCLTHLFRTKNSSSFGEDLEIH